MIAEMTNHLWQSTVFAIVVGLLTLAFRKNRAQVRYWLWLSASWKFLLPFSLLMSLGSHLDWAPATQKIAGAPAVTLKIGERFPGPAFKCGGENRARPRAAVKRNENEARQML